MVFVVAPFVTSSCVFVRIRAFFPNRGRSPGPGVFLGRCLMRRAPTCSWRRRLSQDNLRARMPAGDSVLGLRDLREREDLGHDRYYFSGIDQASEFGEGFAFW